MNNTQRTTLDKIFREEYKTIKSELRDEINREHDTESKAIIERFAAKHKKLINAINKANELWKESRVEFEKNGMSLEGLDEKGASIKFKYFYYGDRDRLKNKELLQLDIKKEAAIGKLNSRENEIRKVIWGEDLNYEEMQAKVNDIFEQLRKDCKVSNDGTKS